MYSTRFSFVTGMSRPPGTRSLTFIRTNRQHKQTQPREEVGGAHLHGSEHVVSDREDEYEEARTYRKKLAKGTSTRIPSYMALPMTRPKNSKWPRWFSDARCE